jgi:hypothetical protein
LERGFDMGWEHTEPGGLPWSGSRTSIGRLEGNTAATKCPFVPSIHKSSASTDAHGEMHETPARLRTHQHAETNTFPSTEDKILEGLVDDACLPFIRDD